MTLLKLHKNATANMQELFTYMLPYGRGDSSSVFWYDTLNLARKKIKGLVIGGVNVSLELQKMMLIDIAGHYITFPNPVDDTGKITKVTDLRTALIAELDSNVDTYYNARSYLFDTPTIP